MSRDRNLNGSREESVSEYSYKRKYSRIESSKVLHVTNLPYDMTENHLNQLCSPFGEVIRVVMIKNKDEGLIEMEKEYLATTILDYFDVFEIYFRGNKLFFEYSNHQSLNVRETENCLISNTPVLNVKIDKMTCAVTLDVLYQIFSQQGQVLKISTFDKNEQFNALIQYADSFQAAKAKNILNGQNIYNNCCTLKIEFYNKSDFYISPNDLNSRDFTLPLNNRPLLNHFIGPDKSKSLLSINSLPTLAAASLLQNVMGNLSNSINPLLTSFNSNDSRSSDPNEREDSYSSYQDNSSTPVLLVSNLTKEMSDPDRIFTLFGAFGDVLKVKILYNKRDTAMVEMMDKHQAGMAIKYLNGYIVFGKQIHITSSKYNEISSISGPLRESEEDDKNGSGLGGKRFLNKVFIDSPLHRYRKEGSKNYKNICHPSNVLHLSNIPSNLTEDDVRHIFIDAGFAVEYFKFLPKSRNMALIRLPSDEEAIKALVLLNNYRPNCRDSGNGGGTSSSSHIRGEDRCLRVSFSTSKL